MRVLTIGHFTIDSVTLSDGTQGRDLFGGDGVYAAVGAAIWGATVRTVSVVGTDYPRTWLHDLRSAGIGIGGVRSLRVRHKLIARMAYDKGFRRQNERGEPNPATQGMSRSARARRWATFSPKRQDAEAFTRWADAVHIAGMPINRQDDFLSLFSSRSRLVTLDLPWPPDLYDPGAIPRVDLASAVLLSDAESKGIFPGQTPRQVRRSLRLAGAQTIVLKRGSKGSIVFPSGTGSGTPIRPFPTRVVDPTGAGDAYCGGFLVGMAETSDPEIAGLYGAVSASFVIEGFGAGYALRFGRVDAERRLRNFRRAAIKAPRISRVIKSNEGSK